MTAVRWVRALAAITVIFAFAASAAAEPALRGTGDLGVIVERASGRVQIIETSGATKLARLPALAI